MTQQTTALAERSGQNGSLSLAPQFRMSLDDLAVQVKALATFKEEIMDKGTDYDVIPGTLKPSLLKPGAEKLAQVFQMRPVFAVTSRLEDWERGFFQYEVDCTLISKQSGETVGNGLGSANSKESRYRWRNVQAICPACGHDLMKSKQNPEWFCWAKKGGCGATFPLADIQAGGRVENDDPYTLVNTLLKMAQKRALIAAVLVATAASGIFTQDVEDMDLGPRAVYPGRPLVDEAADDDRPVAAAAEDDEAAAYREYQAAMQTNESTAPAATGQTCEDCGAELTETRFNDGTVWRASQLAGYGRRKHGKVLCMACYRKANDARKAAALA